MIIGITIDIRLLSLIQKRYIYRVDPLFLKAYPPIPPRNRHALYIYIYMDNFHNHTDSSLKQPTPFYTHLI